MKINIVRNAALAAALGLIGTSAQAQQNPENCSAIADMTYPDLRIASVEYLDKAEVEGVALPPHCLVSGFLEERTGSDGKPYATGFELRIPADWNKRLFFQGGGGTDGSVQPAYGTNTIGQPPALTLGFAVVSTDAGHSAGGRSDTTFGFEPKARVDWGYNSVDIVATAAKAILQKATGSYPAYSYFVGNSNGGRQGLMAAMRYPNQFDGILASNPIKQQTKGHVAGAWSVHVLSAVAPKDEQGRPIFSKFYSDADFDLLAGEITRQCDKLDGLEDGIVDSARLCAVDFTPLLCTGDKSDSCLTQDQITAFEQIHKGPFNAAGEELYAPFAYDAGADFMGWHVGEAETFPNTGRKARNTSMHNVFRDPPQADFDVYAFDFERDPPLMNAASQFTDAKSSDLDAFKYAGGKLMVFHGMGDSGISAIDTTRWYETVMQRYGDTEAANFARLYLLTGVQHGRTGPGPHEYQGLDALMAWVEEGNAPEAMTVSGGEPARTRPLCAYPAYVTWDAARNDWGCQ